MTTRRIDPITSSQDIAPSLVWFGDSGDFVLAAESDPQSPLGLSVESPLLSAITLQMFTDSRGTVDPIDPSLIDLRGWPGDGFDVDATRGETPLGNPNWTLRRRPVNAETARLAEINIVAALDALVEQGVASRIEARATPIPAQRRIDMTITITRPNGGHLYAGPLSGLWEGLKGKI